MNMNEQMMETIQQIFKEAFPELSGQTLESIERKSVPEWDSLVHLQLITDFEEAFHIEFTGIEIMELDSFQKAVKMIKDKVE